MNQEAARKDWNERGFSFGIFRDPPGHVWADFVHRTDELVMLAEGEIELEIEGKTQIPLIGQEVFIPANAIHTVRMSGTPTTFGITVIVPRDDENSLKPETFRLVIFA